MECTNHTNERDESNDQSITSILNYFAKNKDDINALEKKIESCGEDYCDLVNVYYDVFVDKYKSTGEKRWFYFSDGRWQDDKEGKRIIRDFYQTVQSDMHELITYEEKQINLLHQQKFSTYQIIMPQNIRQEKIARARHIILLANTIIDMIENNSYKQRILFSLKIHLYDETFIDKLDSKPNLLGFNNGVWDFDTMTFRASMPSDMISRTVGYDYTDIENEEAVREVNTYLSLLFLDSEQRDYVVRIIARQLYGDKTNSCFYIHKGRNGIPQCGKKSFFHILEACLGEHVMHFSMRYLTGSVNIFNTPQPIFEDLRGVRILFCYDYGNKIRTPIFKQFNRNGTLSYRLLYQNKMDNFKSMFKMHIMTSYKVRFKPYDNNVQMMARYIEYPNDFGLHPTRPSYDYIEKLQKNTAFKMEFVRRLLSSFDKDFQ